MKLRQHLGKDVLFERMPFGQNHYLVFGFHYSFPEVRLSAQIQLLWNMCVLCDPYAKTVYNE